MDEIGGTGPPPIPSGAGRRFLTIEEPFRTVVLDAAVFDWLWRIAEAKYRQHSSNGVVPEQVAVAKRAVIAFREAAGTLGLPPVPSRPRKRLVRTPKG
jgi:hypothetical protein